MSLLSHKITVNKRIIESDFANRHDKYRKARRERIKECIVCIRRLQNNPTQADIYDNPAHIKKNNTTGKWLTNIYDPTKADARIRHRTSPTGRAGSFRQLTDEEWNQRLKWIDQNIIGPPKASQRYTQKQLKNNHIVGLYVPDLGGKTTQKKYVGFYNKLGYRICLIHAAVLIDEYTAGNHKQDSTVVADTDDPCCLSLNHIRRNCFSTGKEIATENHGVWGGAEYDE